MYIVEYMYLSLPFGSIPMVHEILCYSQSILVTVRIQLDYFKGNLVQVFKTVGDPKFFNSSLSRCNYFTESLEIVD